MLDKQQEAQFGEDIYFKSIVHRYIFALMELDGESRQRVLSISRELYHDKEQAKNWRDHIAKQIHPDVCNVIGAEDAMSKLNELYARMIADE